MTPARVALAVILTYAAIAVVALLVLYGCSPVVLWEERGGFTNTIVTFPAPPLDRRTTWTSDGSRT